MKTFFLRLGTLIFSFCVCHFALAQSPSDKHISAGIIYSLYVDSDGQLWAWGRSRFSLGHDERMPHPVSEKVRSVYVKADSYTPFFIMEDSSLWGWGDSTDGQLGVIEKINSKSGGFIRQPRKIMNRVTQVSGEQTPFALKSDGTLWTWGSSGIQRGDTIDDDWTAPRKVMDGVEQVSSTFAHTVVRKKDGSLWAWGDNQCGALGTGDTKESVKPVRVDVKPLENRKVVQIAVRWGETYLLADDGTVWYSGEYNIHQDGCIDPPRLVPTKLDSIDNVGAIALGQFHELYLKKDGSVWASGYAEGAASTLWTVPKGPGKVMDGVAEIAAGPFHSIALKKDGTVWTWGVNEYGQLGDGTNRSTTTPVQVHFPKP